MTWAEDGAVRQWLQPVASCTFCEMLFLQLAALLMTPRQRALLGSLGSAVPWHVETCHPSLTDTCSGPLVLTAFLPAVLSLDHLQMN